MGSSGGSANPMFLSQGGVPMPNIPIAGQGTSDPQQMGKYQSFLPDLPAAGGGPAPSAHGITSEMMQFKPPGGAAAPAAAPAAAAPAAAAPSSEADSLRQQLAALAGGGGGGGEGQFGAARDGTTNQTWNPYGPIPAGYSWVNGRISGPGTDGSWR